MVERVIGLRYHTGLLGGNVSLTFVRRVHAENYFVFISIRPEHLFYMTSGIYAMVICRVIDGRFLVGAGYSELS